MITILVDGTRNFYVLASGELTSKPPLTRRGTGGRYPSMPRRPSTGSSSSRLDE